LKAELGGGWFLLDLKINRQISLARMEESGILLILELSPELGLELVILENLLSGTNLRKPEEYCKEK